MKFTRYTDIQAFHRDTFTIMMRHEAQNAIPLGNVIMGNKGEDKTDWRDPANWFMGTVSDAQGIVLTAVMTPPHKLTLYCTDNKINSAALACLLDEILAAGIPFPGVMTEKTLATLFAKMYAVKTGNSYETETDLRLYELEKVNPDIPRTTVRLAEERDLAFLPYWDAGFNGDSFHKPFTVPTNAENTRNVINRKNRFIMEVDGTPVTCAGLNMQMENICKIGPVYTPPYFRGNGYATQCVAAVSQIGLDKGFKKCVLYTDLANPTSNSIYMKIGYTPICDFLALNWVYA
ncbi:MAG: GNAT family N-acetyltransferase [Defluviitaleaceae bacterium]|nr:GNAT family N-acetyltransferase [Defluviitaleaceae bacterium]MCL2276165.1 GNAT family N-acetyltransferase [Defluviitaleaceae bacterium]